MTSSTTHLINLLSFIFNTFYPELTAFPFATHSNSIILISYSIPILGCSLPTPKWWLTAALEQYIYVYMCLGRLR